MWKISYQTLMRMLDSLKRQQDGHKGDDSETIDPRELMGTGMDVRF